ncbi:MAG: hypothetical protein AAF717_10590 [Bacteroidota bacterium]
MKKLIKNVLYTSIVAMALLFTACQDEFEEVGNNDQETLEAGSATAELIVKTASNDGSFDNIVDEASCIAVQFPYTVDVGGVQITIDSIEDLRLIEEIFDEFDDDEDILEIIFPITIVLADFTEVVIESKEALRELAANCLEGGADDDIECIDFVYPITLFTFDIDGQQADSFVINSDRELHRFFEDREDDELVSIDFPVTLMKFDGTEIVVNSNAELARVLDAAAEECDEDDDDDFNDDDFDEERFVEYLTECPWKIRELRRASIDQVEQYPGAMLNFMENGEVALTGMTSADVLGSWTFEFTDEGPKVELNFGMLADFNLVWYVYEIEEDVIKFYSDSENKIILKRRCDMDDNGDDNDDDTGDDGNDDNGIISIETLTNTLKECEWIIEELELQGEDVDRLLGYEFIFGEGGMLTLGDGITTFDGTWEVGANTNGERTLFIEVMSEPSVNLQWPVVEIDGESVVKTSEVVLKDEASDSEMTLQKSCDDGDNEVGEIRNIMLGGGLWNVTLYDNEGMDSTDDYAGMDFGFSMFNQVEVSINDDPIVAGVWRAIRDTKGNLQVYLNLGTDSPFGELTEPWYVTQFTTDRIELVYEDEEINFKTLVFEKKM